MKFAIFLLLVLSSLCDLEVKNQPEPLVQESQKYDIQAPAARRLAIGHRFVRRVRPMNVAAHRLQFPANRARVHRRLGIVRRRFPVRRRTDEVDSIADPDNSGTVEDNDISGTTESQELESTGGSESQVNGTGEAGGDDYTVEGEEVEPEANEPVQEAGGEEIGRAHV